MKTRLQFCLKRLYEFFIERYSLPQPSPPCPILLEQSSTHLQVKEVQCDEVQKGASKRI